MEDPLEICCREERLPSQALDDIAGEKSLPRSERVWCYVLHRGTFIGVHFQSDDVRHGPRVDGRVCHPARTGTSDFALGFAKHMAMDTAPGDLALVVQERCVSTGQRRIVLGDLELSSGAGFLH